MVSVLKALMILKCKLYAEAELHRSTPQSLSGYLPIPLIACTSLSALRGYLARREAYFRGPDNDADREWIQRETHNMAHGSVRSNLHTMRRRRTARCVAWPHSATVKAFHLLVFAYSLPAKYCHSSALPVWVWNSSYACSSSS